MLFTYQDKPLGTADAVNTAFKNKEVIKTNTTLILYGDTPLIFSANPKKALNDFKDKSLDLSIISMVVKDVSNSYGRLILKKGKVEKIIEKSELNEQSKNIQICNSGIMIVKTKHLREKLKIIDNKNYKKEFYLTDLVEIFDKENYKVSNFNGKVREFMGINDKKDLAKLEKEFQENMRNFFFEKRCNYHRSSVSLL